MFQSTGFCSDVSVPLFLAADSSSICPNVVVVVVVVVCDQVRKLLANCFLTAT